MPAALLLLLVTAHPTPVAAAPIEGFAECEARIAARPDDREAGYCFYETARTTGAWAAAAERLRRHLDRAPSDPWLHYYLGNVLWASRAPEAIELYRRAAELFTASGEAAAAARSWLNLAFFLRLTDRHAESVGALEEAHAAARLDGDPMLLAQIELEQVRQELRAGQDFARAYWQLRRIERIAFPDAPYAVRRDCLLTLAMVAHNLGRWDEVRSYRRRGVELGRIEGDRYFQVAMLYGLAAVELADPQGIDAAALVEQYEGVLEAAREVGHRMVEVEALRDLGRLLGGEEGRRLLEACVEISRDLGQDVQLSLCLRGLAVLVAEDDPAYAEALLDEALSRALVTGDPWPMVYGWIERLAVRWKTLPREAALEDSLRVLDLIEALRELQGSQTGRLGIGAVWSEAFYWLSGRLLGSDPSPEEVAVAFNSSERARARGLLEELTPRAGQEDAETESAPRRELALRDHLVQEMVEVHRRLLAASTSEKERRLLLERLEDLEAEELALREAAREAAGVPDFVELTEVQHALDADEALLTFQLSPWQDPYGEPGSGSWLLVITDDEVRHYPIPDRGELQPATDVFLGLVKRRHTSESHAAAALGERLLGVALDELPAETRSLILIPDGPLHQIPFAALRTVTDGPPLIERFHLTTVPSASLWLGWRRKALHPTLGGALVFADPLPAGGPSDDRPSSDRGSTLRAWALTGEWRPGALPQARREGLRIAELLGRGSRVLVGDEASEARLKSDVGAFTALHFAAHALVDGERPQRSAVLLAPGERTEDGLLQAREIVSLDLRDRLIVLSACRSATGAILEGEGSMSLARAFFQAGARAVVAAPWPLRDDEARRLTEALYRRLVAGSDLATALSEAQREHLERGLPIAGWAGLQLYGDGAWTPFSSRPPRRWWRLALLALLGAAALSTLFVLRRSRSSLAAPDRKTRCQGH